MSKLVWYPTRNMVTVAKLTIAPPQVGVMLPTEVSGQRATARCRNVDGGTAGAFRTTDAAVGKTSTVIT